jgi:hypothetical protein
MDIKLVAKPEMIFLYLAGGHQKPVEAPTSEHMICGLRFEFDTFGYGFL